MRESNFLYWLRNRFHDFREKRSPIPKHRLVKTTAIIFGVLLLLLAFAPLFHEPLRDLIRDKEASYTCPDGTVVYLSEFLDNDTYSTPDDLAQNPPPHWCEEAIDWVANLNFFNWAKFCCLWMLPMLFMSGFLMFRNTGQGTLLVIE